MQEYYKLAQGIEALIKLHHVNTKELARYLEQYLIIKQED